MDGLTHVDWLPGVDDVDTAVLRGCEDSVGAGGVGGHTVHRVIVMVHTHFLRVDCLKPGGGDKERVEDKQLHDQN